MKYYIDTEFCESGPHKPIDLISIGIVAEDGRELYAVSAEFNPQDANDWVKANVLPHLGDAIPTSLDVMAVRVERFMYDGQIPPEIWGYYADYDWIVFCQIFGRMIDLPKGWPMFCNDIKQLAMMMGNPKLPEQIDIEHNALNDARWNKVAYDFLIDRTNYVIPKVK